ncbi:hypothetical protein [Marinoscillum furvescens]|uniref:Sporulation related protein n=1 Tax=Marinoscillum furvescens DSM 4134 TaxID=1122208 RepID=A0A3D9LGX3_MARFU|nr:hypothetical protein [Marinoscillum furvescens]REE05858.1 hypothetical protein C7460_101377 [Marinoscillum furvescens DSM 4134]
MRTARLLICVCVVLAVGCKSSKKVTSSTTRSYSEDLSVLRPELTVEEEAAEPLEANELPKVPAGHLRAELDSVSQIIAEQNRRQRYVDGHTIQIYTGSDREQAQMALDTVQVYFPELDASMQYHQPNYKVKVGQYVSRLRAHEVFEAIKVYFPLALMLPERIRIDYD